MLKFNKALNSKIISVIIACVFLFNNTAYGVDLSEKSLLRKHIDFNDVTVTPRYLCVLLAATYHSSILKDKLSSEQAFARVMEAMNKSDSGKQGIKVVKHKDSIWIYSEQANIYIVAYDNGQFGSKSKKEFKDANIITADNQSNLDARESRRRLIADRLGISIDQMGSWERANPEKAKRLEEMAERDDGTEIYLKGIDARNVIVDRNDPEFTYLYSEADGIVKRLLKAAGFNPDNFSFYLLDSTAENAFVLRYSNKIFVNIGLIKFIVENGGSKDALAFVLAHEMRHILQWVDDTIEGKPLERGLTGLLGSHADEYDADYALALIDKAGYSVRDAGFFFAKFIEKKGKGSRISLGFLTHPPTVERLRKIERDVLKFFWMNFFNKSEHFSDASKQELNNRTDRRKFQEEVAQSNTAEEVMSCLNKAQSPEEFIFVLMVAWQKDIRIDIGNAYNMLLSKFGIAEEGKKEAYRIIFDILKIDLNSLAGQRGGIIIRGALGVTTYAVDELPKRFAAMSISELIELLSIEVLKPTEFDSYGVKLKGIYDFNYAAYASALCYALGKRIEDLYRSGFVTDVEQLLELMRLFQQRYMEIDAYIQEAIPPDVKGALEKMIVILLGVLNDQAKAGHAISEKHVDTMLYFLDIMERGTSYSEGEDAMKVLCEFMKNASVVNKNMILSWLLKGDAEKPSKFRDYFFEHMARDINLMDILPGMGNSAEEDLDILFSNPYFLKHSIFAEAHIGKEPMASTRLNTLMAFLYNLKQKYGLSAEETVALCEHAMGKLRTFSVDSKLERIYELMYREIGLFGKMKISDPINRKIEQDSDIPKDLNPEVKKLIYFYKMGGVLGFRDLRQVFFSISARHRNIGEPDFENKDVQVFYNVLISLSSEVKGRYEEKEDFAKELRWNKYILPFALFLSFDRQSLSEEESKYENTKPITIGRSDGTTEERPGRPTRFGRFVGEFNPFGILTRFGSRDDYQKTKVDRGRGINRVFLTGENVDVLLQVFDYIVTSDKDFEVLLNEISRTLPATTYRNFALYMLFVEKFLKQECGVSIDVTKPFDLGYIQNIIGNLNQQERIKALQILSRISSLMVRDIEMAQLNEPNQNVLSKLEDAEKQRISGDHTAEESGYYPFEYTELGGPLSQLDIFVGLLAEKQILDALKSTESSFGEKLDFILEHFTRKSSTRDRFLTILIEGNIDTSTSVDIEKVLPLFNNESFREKYAVLALEKKRSENLAEFSTLEGELKWILHYFPELSPARDDILLQLIDEKVNTPSDMKKIRPYLLKAPENIREKKQARVVFGTSVFEEYMKNQNAADKMEFLFWVLGISDKKPFFLKRFEHEYNVSLNGMRDNFMKRRAGYYKNVGDSTMEEFLEKVLLGEKGIFYDEKVSAEFLEVLFNTLMPSQKNNIMRVVYDAIFRQSDVNKKYAIVAALLKNFSREKSSPEGISEARAIRIFLGSLGLIGVKMAQFLSTYETIPEDMRNELKLLKDRAPQLSKDVVFDMIAKIYGSFEDSPISEVLECIGSASIKVVYRARLKDGREIVIKIKRPEVEKKVEEDLAFLRNILSDQTVQDTLRDNDVEIPQQLRNRIAEMILEEMNLKGEVENQTRLREGVGPASSFRKRLANKIFNYFISKIFKTPQRKYLFKIPATIDVRNNTLIIEDFVNGRRIGVEDDDAMVAVARELMRQIFIDGFYHADPHTGNIFVNYDGDAIYFIDVGSASQISFKNRYILYKLMKALNSSNGGDVLKVIKNISGRDMLKLGESVNDIATSKDNVVKKIVRIFKILEDSNVAINKELISIFRCFAQGEPLFKAALLSGESTAIQSNLDAQRLLIINI
jgi:predicted unusual protein kinase regulating ubiquinone biosynthesis (AarF/ABC1/UbiB family)